MSEACIDDDALERALDGRLEPSALEVYVAHAAGCDDCRDLLAAAGKLRSAEVETVVTANVGRSSGDLQTPPAHSLGRYVILGELGRGGMGRVLRAYDPKLQREVAIKEVRDAALDARGFSALVAEARAMARLSHPNVVAVYDVERVGERVVLIMECVLGSTLRDWVGSQQRAWGEVVDRFIQAGRGLAAAHAVGLLHRDFKPANVLLSESTVKVADFGLAKPGTEDVQPTQSEGVFDDDEDAPLRTATGFVLGTPRYMAPEQHAGRSLTAAVDQYAFCVALWEALCGRPPFSGHHAAEDKRGGPPPWGPSAAPRAIGEVLERGMAPDPGDRWPNMDALLKALRRASRGRQRLGIGVAASIAIASGAALAGWTLSDAGAAPCIDSTPWDESRRDAVRAAFAEVSSVEQPASSDSVIAGLDAYATRWSSMQAQWCEAHATIEQATDPSARVQHACLQEASAALDAVSAVLADPDPAVVNAAGNLLGSLPELSACEDVASLRDGIGPPPRDEADAVARMRGFLASAHTASLVARYVDMKANLDDARALGEAEGVEYVPVLAEVSLMTAKFHEVQADEASMLEELDRTIELSARAGTRGTHWLAHVGAMDALRRLNRHDEAARHGAISRGLAAGSRYREAVTAQSLGQLLHERDDLEGARVHYEEAAALLEDEDDWAAPHRVTVQVRLASVANEQGRQKDAARAFELASKLAEETFPAEHPARLSVEANRLIFALEHEASEALEPEFRSLLRRFRAAHGPVHPMTAVLQARLGELLLAIGQPDDAERQLTEAVRILENARGPEHPRTVWARELLDGIQNHPEG